MKTNLSIALGLLSGLALATPVFAEEGGSGHYLPGSTASFIDALPGHPSFAAENIFTYYNTSASASRQLPVAGLTTLGLDAIAYADSLVAFYETPVRLFGGNYAAGLAIPFVWMDAKARVVTPAGTLTRQDSASGLGDITVIPFMLGWTNGTDFKYDVRLNIYAPSGDYTEGALANVGKNYWTFEPTLSASYLSSKIGLELTAFAAVDFNTKNAATDYQTGNQFHIDGTIAQHLRLFGGVIGVGPNGYYYRQVTADSGSGARFGSFEGLTSGAGPTISYIRQFAKKSLAAEIKWIPELHVNHRPQGDYVWFKFTLLF